MFSRDEILEKLSREVADIKKSFSVTKIGLFGSIVRNESSQQSDIDILVELSQPTFDNYMDLKFYLEKLFGEKVDLVMSDTVKPRLREYIEQEVIYA